MNRKLHEVRIIFINDVKIEMSWSPVPSLMSTIKMRLMGRDKFVEMIRQAFEPGLEDLRRDLEAKASQELKVLTESRGDH